MAQSAYLPGLAIRDAETSDLPRRSVLVRITHWVTTLAFFGLLVSGVAILLAHPRLYWGETGAIGSPSLIDLPLPFVLVNQTSWGRSLHFLSAWVCVLTGLLYVAYGLFTRHFRKEFVPEGRDLAWSSISRVILDHLRLKRSGEEEPFVYNVVQRLTYLVVVFLLFPLVIWTGLAMSPALTSVFPWLVTVFGGQQSARTIHFFVASALVLFLLVHVAMVCRAGFAGRVRAMIFGRSAARREGA